MAELVGALKIVPVKQGIEWLRGGGNRLVRGRTKGLVKGRIGNIVREAIEELVRVGSKGSIVHLNKIKGVV